MHGSDRRTYTPDVRKDQLAEQSCSIARTAAVIGDAWTLLILREAFLGHRRFADFVEFTGAQPSVVSDRVKKLVDAGVLEPQAYQDHPPRNEYRLTDKGKDLHPVLLTLAAWGDTHLDDGRGAPVVRTHTTCGHSDHPHLVCGHCAERLTPRTVRATVGPGADPDDIARRTR